MSEAKNKVVVKESGKFSWFHILRDLNEDKLTSHAEIDTEKEVTDIDVNFD